jgi:hypothetical protein
MGAEDDGFAGISLADGSARSGRRWPDIQEAELGFPGSSASDRSRGESNRTGDLVELVMASKRPIAARSELAESGQEAAAARRSLDASASACACEDERKKGGSERDGSGRA